MTSVSTVYGVHLVRSDFRAVRHDEPGNAAVFMEFLKRLVIRTDRPLFPIGDHDPIQEARRVEAFVNVRKGHLQLLSVPPRSPQLNPDEQVWAHVTRRFARHLVQSKEDTKRLAFRSLRRFRKLPDLMTSVFRQPERQLPLSAISCANVDGRDLTTSVF